MKFFNPNGIAGFQGLEEALRTYNESTFLLCGGSQSGKSSLAKEHLFGARIGQVKALDGSRAWKGRETGRDS